MTIKMRFQTFCAVLLILAADACQVAAQSTPQLFWNKISGPWDSSFDGSFGAIAIHPTNPNVIFIVSSVLGGPGVLKSSDGGATWTAKNSGIEKLGLPAQNYPPITTVVISSSNPNTIYFGTAVDDPLLGIVGNVYKTVDGGESWQKVSSSQLYGAVYALDVHPTNANMVYAGVTGKGVLKTSNGGTDWSVVLAGGSVPGSLNYFNIVRIVPTQPETLFVSGFTAYLLDLPAILWKENLEGIPNTTGVIPLPLKKSINGGTTWNNQTIPSGPLLTDLEFERASGALYASTIAYKNPAPLPFGVVDNKGIFKSTDTGEHWQAVNQAAFGSLDQIPFVSLSANPSSVNKGVFASTGFGDFVIATTDTGTRWLRLDPSLLNAYIGRTALAGNKLFVLTSLGIYVTDVSSLYASGGPNISSVSPSSLTAIALPQTQLMKVFGSDFTETSTLTFSDGVNAPYTGRVPTFISSTELHYNISVGPNEANWTVQVINGGQQSNLSTFTVVKGGMIVIYEGTAIPNGDQSPSAAKGTDFGTIVYGFQSPAKTFTISNTLSRGLNLTAIPRVQFGGSNPSDFYMTALPSSPVAVNGSTTFKLVFEPSVNTGTRSATITIANDDPNKNPYTFNVQGKAMIQMRVDPSLEYNGVESLNNDQTPTVSKGTDFGSADVASSSSTHTFRFYNYGTISMALTGSMLQMSGANKSDFSIVTMPTSPIASGQYATIAIKFQPSGLGLRTASLLISFDSTYGLGATSPYTVAVVGTGTGTTRTISLEGNMGFGNVITGTSGQATLTVANNGNSILTVTGITFPIGFGGNWTGSIQPGNSQSVSVAFSPVVAIDYVGNIFVSSDATSGTANIAVSGRGVKRPSLSVFRDGSDLLLTWPSDVSGLSLEYATSLPAPSWTPIPGIPIIVDGNYTLSIPIARESTFYRLKK